MGPAPETGGMNRASGSDRVHGPAKFGLAGSEAAANEKANAALANTQIRVARNIVKSL